MKTFNKWLTATVVLTTAFSPFTSNLASAAPIVADIAQADAWAQDSILQAKSLNLMSGDPSGNFRPLESITRQELAVLFANLLKLDASGAGTSSFSDVTSAEWGFQQIEAVKKAGVMLGDGNGTFRPDGAVTREELAVLLVKAAKLDVTKQDGNLQVADKDSVSPWAMPYVAAAIAHGLMKGDGTNFNPQQTAQRQEVAVVAVRLASGSTATATHTINSLVDGTVTIDGVAYQPSDALKGFFTSGNAAALKGAKVAFEATGKTLTKLTGLELVNGGQAAAAGTPEFSGNIVLDGVNTTIDGDIKVAADYITVKNLIVSGNLEIGKELQNDFYSTNLTVTGKTLVNGGDTNTVVFENAKIGPLVVNKPSVHIEPRGTTTVGEVTVSSDATITADAGITLPKLTVLGGASQVEINANVSNLEVASQNATTLSGNGHIATLNVTGPSALTLNTTGAIDKLSASDKNAKFTLNANAKIGNLELPDGVKASDIVQNYDQVKANIPSVNGTKNPDSTPTPAPSNGSTGGGTTNNGGGTTDNGGGTTNNGGTTPTTNLPVITYNSYENHTPNSVDLDVQSDKSGTVSYIVQSNTSRWPSAQQILNGTDGYGMPVTLKGTFDVQAGATASHTITGFNQSSSYGIFYVVKDASGAVSAIGHQYLYSYQANTTTLLPFPTQHLNELKIEFSGALKAESTSYTNVADLITGSYIRNYGVQDIHVNSMEWDLSHPNTPKLILHFDEVSLASVYSVYIGFEHSLWFANTNTGNGGIGHGEGSTTQQQPLFFKQVLLSAGNTPDPSRAQDTVAGLKDYHLQLANVHRDFAIPYQEAISNAANGIVTLQDLQTVVDTVNTNLKPDAATQQALDAVNSASWQQIQAVLEANGIALGLETGSGSAYDNLSVSAKSMVADDVYQALYRTEGTKFLSAWSVKYAFDQSVIARSSMPFELQFQDTDARTGYYQGHATFAAAPNETSIDSYELYWRVDNDATVLATLPKDTLSYDIPQDTVIAPNARLGVRAVYTNGLRSDGYEISLQDLVPQPPAEPNVTKDEKYNILIGADHTMEYSTDNGTTWTAYNEQNPPVFPGNPSVYVRVAANGDTPAGMTALLSFVDNVYLYVGSNNYSNDFSDASNAMEYSTDNGATWTTYDEANPPHFPGDLTVLLREKGDDVTPPAASRTFTFTSAVNLELFSDTNNSFLIGGNSYEYSLDKQTWTQVDSEQTVQDPSFTGDTYVYVREKASGNFLPGKIYRFQFTTANTSTSGTHGELDPEQ